MSTRLRWSSRALKDLKKLDPPTRSRVVEALERLRDLNQGDVRRLKDVEPPEWRLRVGDLRARFALPGDDEVFVLRVLPRDKVYRS